MDPGIASRDVRPAAVAGLFYPSRAGELSRDVNDALAQARQVSFPAQVKALIVPHAGYVYSGRVAAAAYGLLRGRTDIARIVLLGPCHRVAVRGLALPNAEAFATPLGEVPVDRDAVASIASLPQVVTSAAAHAQEHSLEVQLPFLQTVVPDFTLVPLAVGDASPEEVGQVIDRLYGGPETLIVVSSDLSHYHSYESARFIDSATVREILEFHTGIDHGQACGATPIAGLLTIAKRRGLVPTLLDQCTSGDTAGDRVRVVGYAAFAFTEGRQATTDDLAEGEKLVSLARGAIHEALGGPAMFPVAGAWLDVPRATFVTLRQDAKLRGCIGSLEATRPLREDVIRNARAAALADPRFPPLTCDELPDTRIEVSVLGVPVPLVYTDRAHLAAQLVPGADGLIVMAGRKRATFLPQVWESVPDAGTFVDELLRKARLPEDIALEHVTFARYGVRKWAEAD
jgi:AmmeMemoRadiSam system protein B/AmmeMemoRadiSam system protein A